VYATSSIALIPEGALVPPQTGRAQHGLLADYFDNDGFQGRPVLSRVEPRGYFVWAMHDPAVVRVVSSPTYSLRWTAALQVPAAGDYQLGIARQECDSCPGTNSVKLYLDDRLLVNESQKSYAGRRTFGASVHLEAGKAYHLKMEYAQREGGPGVELVWAPPAVPTLREAVSLAKQSDLAILCVGLNSRLEGEESPIDIPGFSHGDRTDIRLPDPQQKLLEAVLDTGKPVIVVLINGSALAVQTAKDRARAIVEAWYGGQEAGTAIANTLSGDNNPAGRLPVTFYESVDQLPPFSDYSMNGRTYRYFKGNPLYPFGYGLSYSRFSYSKTSSKQTGGGKQQLSARVTNISKRSGDEVVQLYLSDPNGGTALKGFQRIRLGAGESKDVSFAVEANELSGKVPHIGGNAPRR
jgi:beta-glucosidase